jgi:hypothetical protein
MVNPGGTGNPAVGHLGQAGALAAQHILHAAVAVGLPPPKKYTYLDWS